MTNPKSPFDMENPDRRSGFNRRWIKSHYCGQERRRVKDRREGLPAKDLLVAENLNSKKMVGFEKLMVSTTIQLEADNSIAARERNYRRKRTAGNDESGSNRISR